MINKARNIWEKNWPEIHSGIRGGLPKFLFSRRPQPLGEAVPVFCYHLVDEVRFHGDLKFLADNGYYTIDADTLLNHVTGERLAPEKSIVISFDDGSQNLFDIAFPILQEFNMNAVVFIAPGLHADTHKVTSPFSLLSWDTIKAMQGSGVFDFQAHTLEHRYVPRWPEWIELAGADQKALQERIVGPLPMEQDFKLAKELIQKKLGKPVRHMAFPKFFGTDNALLMGKYLGYEGFWWGSLPGRPINTPQSGADRIVRLEGQFIRRLPGANREKLRTVLGRRYFASLQRFTGMKNPE